MADEKKLEEVIADKPAPASTEQDKKEEVKANLDKAIVEAQETLRQTRADIKKAKTATEIEDENLPEIDMNDPSAKAWDKHIRQAVAPASSQLEKQKDEVRTFALRTFLKDKPALAKNPEKLKELMANYDRIKVATEQTQEGILLDLDKAYGATFHEELISAARNRRLDQAKEDMISSDIAIDRGATAEPDVVPKKRPMTAEEQRIVEQWETMGAPKLE